ncbi:MAG TPA: (Fe-S)-binding protein [Bacteroidia bacterium]|jgi:ferredoxin|nr:(Fe-S)-binding protein [Bacteroidia bacterium]
MVSSIIFIFLFLGGSAFFYINAKKIRRNILLGKDISIKDNKGERLKTMTLVAFGQKKMFSRPIPAILHFFLYAAFVITQVELLEIVFDGAFGHHRAFRASLGGFYTFVVSFIEVLSVLAFVGTIVFLSRRNLLKVPRLVQNELNGWPKLDANFILLGELTLICFIFMMNGADEVLYSRGASHAENLGDGSLGLTISGHVGPLLFGGMSDSTLHIVERIGWWGHIAMVFGFLNYLPFSKHLHILLAFPNTYFSNLKSKGTFKNLFEVTDVVKPNFDPSYQPVLDPNAPVKFGAKDVTDLNWKQLLDAYSCTECGRCTSACPQNITGKKLSPRKIMMDTRDRLVEVGKNIDTNGGKFVDDGRSLLGDYITAEEIWACNTCNACVQECPVNIDPLAIIMDLRQQLVLEQSVAPAALNGMFGNIENNGAPWQFSPSDRANWINEN